MSSKTRLKKAINEADKTMKKEQHKAWQHEQFILDWLKANQVPIALTSVGVLLITAKFKGVKKLLRAPGAFAKALTIGALPFIRKKLLRTLLN